MRRTMRGFSTDRRWPLALTVALSVTVVGCGTGNTDSAVRPKTTVTTSGIPRSGEPVETPATKVPRPADPQAPKVYQAVKRGGRVPSPTVSAKPGSFKSSSAVTYQDGLVLTVTGIRQSLETGRGPGVFPGRPHTAIRLSFTNHSTKALSLNAVVVTTVYGTARLVAAPIYNDPAARDFQGALQPGRTAVATYVFSIPSADLDHVETTVDFDAVHVAATFAGRVG